MMKTILGIDPGLEDTGWAVVKADNNKITLKDFGVIKTKAKLPVSKRLKIIYDNIVEIITKHNITNASIEQAFFINKIKSQMLMVQARGVILLAFESLKIPYSEYNPKAVKINITGNGNANKKQIQNTLKMIFHIEKNIYPDTADAIAIALMDARMNMLKVKGVL